MSMWLSDIISTISLRQASLVIRFSCSLAFKHSRTRPGPESCTCIFSTSFMLDIISFWQCCWIWNLRIWLYPQVQRLNALRYSLITGFKRFKLTNHQLVIGTGKTSSQKLLPIVNSWLRDIWRTESTTWGQLPKRYIPYQYSSLWNLCPVVKTMTSMSNHSKVILS